MASTEVEQPQSHPAETIQLVELNKDDRLSLRSEPASKTAVSVTLNGPPAPEQTPAQLRKERIRFAALLCSFFVMGWDGGSTGALLPAIKAYYTLGFASVSSIFISTCLGSACGAFSLFYMLDRFGFGKVLVLGAVLQTLAYAVQTTAPPFPVFVIFSFFTGMGTSFQGSTGNGFVASLKRNGARKMGVLHAVYGAGAFSAPLAATQFAPMKRWSLFYLISAGLAVSVATTLCVVFRFKRQEVLLQETNSDVHKEEAGAVEHTGGKLKHILALPLVHYLAFYICVYVGVQITLGGWVVTFIVDERGGGPDAGYISSGFFGGLMLGRVLLLPVNAWLGERRVIFLYALLTIVLDIVIWQVRSLIGNGVAVSIIGVLFGPMYPIVMHQAGLILPPRILAGAVGYIAGFGIVGGAVVPFVTGALANRYKIRVMPIVVLVMTPVMALLWGLAMRQHKHRTD